MVIPIILSTIPYLVIRYAYIRHIIDVRDA